VWTKQQIMNEKTCRKRRDNSIGLLIIDMNYNSMVLFSLSQQHNVVPHSTSIIPKYVSGKQKIHNETNDSLGFHINMKIIPNVFTSMCLFLA